MGSLFLHSTLECEKPKSIYHVFILRLTRRQTVRNQTCFHVVYIINVAASSIYWTHSNA